MQTDEQGFEVFWRNKFGISRGDAIDVHLKPLFEECWHAARAFVPTTIQQTLKDIHAAGGHAWDHVDDVDAAIRDMRGDE